MPAGWFTCDVVRAGPADDGNNYIMLSDRSNAFAQVWFIASPNRQNEILATALAAMTANLTVAAEVTAPTTFPPFQITPYGTIRRLYAEKA